VAAGTLCALALDPAPEARAFYAPLGVLNAQTDPDPVTPGYQATLRVASQPGWMRCSLRYWLTASPQIHPRNIATPPR